jgi:hypothetical protein
MKHVAGLCVLVAVGSAMPNQLGCNNPWVGRISGMGRPEILASGASNAFCEISQMPTQYDGNGVVC